MAVEDKGQRLENFLTLSLGTPKCFPGMLLGTSMYYEHICQEGSKSSRNTQDSTVIRSAGENLAIKFLLQSRFGQPDLDSCE